ncbi:hypothetical protein PL78_10350 [Yersinia entomophaga]|uniref:Lipoprotein n=1 Tax=Yersinia entomophaga TaxID=935293 RepID=A0ABM6BLI4_YERET|nr:MULTISPECIES: hypothetical protein [Yersinia]ANI30222.1 hypothetical protein PL78_10350 [Yersinia entomophaga]OWF89386.1 hypothetical protein B4914_03460 [Yersinia entomophaga]
MKSIALFIAPLAAIFLLSSCVVEPARYRESEFVVPPGIVYVAPEYPMPGPGYVWRYHEGHSWGWYHPGHGWHHGWK